MRSYYYDRDSVVDVLTRGPLSWVIAGIVGVVAITALACASDFVFSKPECLAKGEVMNVRTDWGFYSGCMIEARGQMLPWSEVVPAERDGKVIFVPKPHLSLDDIRNALKDTQ